MLTSDNRWDYQNRIKITGIDVCVAKPVSRSKLGVRVLEAIQKTPKETIETVETDPFMKFPPMRILLVEDNLSNRQMFQLFLKNTPFKIDVAGNGKEAVARAANSLYDLILMDMQMPIMDGFEAVKAIRALESERSRKAVPIIALTAQVFENEKQKCLDAGCTAYIRKPVKKNQFLQVVHDVILKAGPSPFDGPEVESLGDSDNDYVARIDTELKPLIPLFLRETRKDLHLMTEALKSNDFEALQGLGHSAKGSAMGYGFDYLGRLCLAIEAAASSKKTHDIEKLLDTYEKYLDRVRVEFKDEMLQ
jgi:CheY-like chemotaxis protein/HPt (histidine-containing phosphotransfer) domain-containing protein